MVGAAAADVWWAVRVCDAERTATVDGWVVEGAWSAAIATVEIRASRPTEAACIMRLALLYSVTLYPCAHVKPRLMGSGNQWNAQATLHGAARHCEIQFIGPAGNL